MAAQTFIRWARLGVWERLLDLARQPGVVLGMTVLDGNTIRASLWTTRVGRRNGHCSMASGGSTPITESTVLRPPST